MNANMGDKSQRLKPLYDDQYGTYTFSTFLPRYIIIKYFYRFFLSSNVFSFGSRQILFFSPFRFPCVGGGKQVVPLALTWGFKRFTGLSANEPQIVARWTSSMSQNRFGCRFNCVNSFFPEWNNRTLDNGRESEQHLTHCIIEDKITIRWG